MARSQIGNFKIPAGISDGNGRRIVSMSLATKNRANSVFEVLNSFTGSRNVDSNAGDILTDDVMAFVVEEIEASPHPASSKALAYLDFARTILRADHRRYLYSLKNYEKTVSFFDKNADAIIKGLSQDLDNKEMMGGAITADLLSILNEPPEQRVTLYSQPSLKILIPKLMPIFERFFEQGIIPISNNTPDLSISKFDQAKRDFLKLVSVNHILIPEFFAPIRVEMLNGLAKAMFELAKDIKPENLSKVRSLSKVFLIAGVNGIDTFPLLRPDEPIKFAAKEGCRLLTALNDSGKKVFVLSMGNDFSVVRRTENALKNCVRGSIAYTGGGRKQPIDVPKTVSDLIATASFWQKTEP